MKVVSIGAHPDDIEMGTGGTLAMHKRRGDDTYGILCTLGGVRGDPIERHDEAKRGASVLGMRLHIIDYPVAKLNKLDPEFVKVIRKVIEDINPDRVYTHSIFDYHQIHVSVANATFVAAKSVNQVLSYEDISSTTTEFRPDAFVDITEFMNLKIMAIEQHRSQLSDRLYIQPAVMRSLANVRYVWSKVGSNPNGLAEAFMVKRFCWDPAASEQGPSF